MKHKFSSMGRVAIALVLALSLSLVMAVPVAATITNDDTNPTVTAFTPQLETLAATTVYTVTVDDLVDTDEDIVSFSLAVPTDPGTGAPLFTVSGTPTASSALGASQGTLTLDTQVIGEVKAQGTLTLDTVPTATTDTMLIDAKTYTFVADVSGGGNVDGNIEIGDLATTQTNIVNAINLTGTPGTGYAALMTAHPTVDIAAFDTNAAVLTAKTAGTAGNSIATTETFTAVTNIFDQATLGLTTAGIDSDTMTVGGKTYKFQDTLTDVNGNIKIGATLALTQANLVAAFDLSGVAGTDYAALMSAHTTVDIADFDTNAAVLTAKAGGTAGNSIATTETFTAVTNIFDQATLGLTTAGSDVPVAGTAQASAGPGGNVGLFIVSAIAGGSGDGALTLTFTATSPNFASTFDWAFTAMTDSGGDVGTATVTTTVEGTAPAAPVADLLVVTMNTSPTVDTIHGLAGAVAIEVPAVTVTVYSDEALTALIDSTTAAADGSFAAIDIGETYPEVWVTATDAVGNESLATSKLNDIIGPPSITAIVGTTYQNGNDTIVITFNKDVQPTTEGPWYAAVFASVKCGAVDLSLVGASFTPASDLTSTLTITLDEDVDYLVKGTSNLKVTPAASAIKDAFDNFLPTDEITGSVGGDSVAPTFTIAYYTDAALTSLLEGDYMKAGIYYIKITANEALSATPTISLGAEGTANDVTNGATTAVAGSTIVFKYTRTILFDAAAVGTTAEVITISGTDLAGNAVTGLAVTGEKKTDTEVPTIAAVDVVGSTTGADTITITFSEDVAATDEDFTDGNEVAGITLKKTGEADVTVDLTGATFAYATNDLTITLAETGNVQDYLINGYTVTFDPSDTNTIEDDAINLLAVTAIDGTTPVDGDVGDPAMSEVVGMIQTGDDTITITFSDKVRPADGTWSANEFSIESPATAPLNINHANFVTDATNTILTITLNQDADGAFLVKGDVVKVTPVANAVLDLAGDSLPTTPMSSAVAIADPAYPYITSIVGTTILGAGDTIVITFSEAVTPEDETWDADEFSITGLTDTTATFVIDGTNTILTITLDEATDNAYLVNDTVIEVTPDGGDHEIFDADDNAVPSTTVVSALVSGDTDAPTIVSIVGTIVPGSGATEKDIIRIDFSEAVVPVDNTWDALEFDIVGPGVQLVGATFAPENGITTTLTITQATGEDLTAGTLTVTPVVDMIVDLAGNKMSAEVDSTAPVQAPSAAFVINLEADWNLISLPLVPTEPDIEAVLAGLVNANTVIQVRAYNVSSGDFFIWASTGPFALNPTLTEMNDGVGFWIEMSTGDKLVASGSELPAPPLSPPSYPVYEGWNLIGFKSLPNLTVSEYLGPLVDGTREAIYGYDAVNKLYIIPTVDAPTGLFPGQGYWLAVNANGTIYP